MKGSCILKARIHRVNYKKGIIFSSSKENETEIIRDFCVKRGVPFYCMSDNDYSLTVKEVTEKFTDTNERISTNICGSKQILIISGFTNSETNYLLDYLKIREIYIPYKCMVTETNLNWKMSELIENIIREHNQMHRID